MQAIQSATLAGLMLLDQRDRWRAIRRRISPSLDHIDKGRGGV
jgi:hypothetical protein